jgi:hypothetical protein
VRAAQHGQSGGPVLLPAEPGREGLKAAHEAALAALNADQHARRN